MGKKVFKKKYAHTLSNGDLVIAEVVDVGDMKYKDGVMYSFRCIDLDGNTLFAIENGHEQAHVHMGKKKDIVDYDWKTARDEFECLLKEHKRKILGGN